jgi:NADH-quinone oxidoreductase subunit K
MTDTYTLLVALAAVLFAVGLAGVVTRRNLLAVVMSLEVMVNAVVLAFVAGAWHTGTLDGAAMTFFIYVAVTCEIALAMALLVLLVRRRGSLDLAAVEELKG